MNDEERACADVADALALLAAAARGGVSDADPRSGTHGVAALVGAIILLARTSAHAPEVIQVAIDALAFAQKTIRSNGRKSRAS